MFGASGLQGYLATVSPFPEPGVKHPAAGGVRTYLVT